MRAKSTRLRLAAWITLGVSIAASLVELGREARSDEPGDWSTPLEKAAAERGRTALVLTGFLKPEWSTATYRNAGKLWEEGAPDPEKDPAAYEAAFRHHYGLHPAPYPNDGLPMGLRMGLGSGGEKTGLQIDCMLCHGGSIGGQSYVGLGNTQLDLKAVLFELQAADGKKPPPFLTFVLNSSRGTNNAGQVAAGLLSFRNPDLSVRSFPLPLAVNLPEMDTPPWWHLKRKRTMYYDGRTDARSVRTNMQFMLGEKSFKDLQALEPVFRDVQAFLCSIEPPKYPFPIDAEKAGRGRVVFENNCTACHGTYGPDGRYPNKIIPLEKIGTDPARSNGLSDRLIAHYNSTWLGADFPVQTKRIGYQAPPLDGIWATAPYLHNGSVPTLHALLESSTRPARFTRPPSTDFSSYDTTHVGWKFSEVTAEELASTAKRSPFQAKFIVNTARFGMGNQGHTFGDGLTAAERSDVIEYLKGL